MNSFCEIMTAMGNITPSMLCPTNIHHAVELAFDMSGQAFEKIFSSSSKTTTTPSTQQTPKSQGKLYQPRAR